MAGVVAGGVVASLAAVPVVSVVPAGATSAPEVVATGLHGPAKLSFDPAGNLYVAESGTRELPADPAASCVGSGDGQVCVGETGSVARVDVDTGAVQRVVTGLPSLFAGPTDVVVQADGSMDVSIGCGCGPDDRPDLPAFSALGTIQHIDPEGARTTRLDLAQLEFTYDPDSRQPGSIVYSDPFDLEPIGDQLYALDAGGSFVLVLYPPDHPSDISPPVAIFPTRTVPAPPPGEPGSTMTMQAVPTAVSAARLPGRSRVLISGQPGYPFPAGEAPIYELAPVMSSYDDLLTFTTGLSGLTDIDQASDGTVYALQVATELLGAEAGGTTSSELVQIRPDGSRKVILREGLTHPGGVAIGPDGMIYVTDGRSDPDNGRVLRVDPTVAADGATGAACDPTEVPGTPYYEEIAPSVHREAIECVRFWGLLGGRSTGEFAPSMPLNRGQTALVIARLLARAGIAPSGGPDAFADDDGTIYEDAIDLVASLGIVRGRADGTFGPGDRVTRAQLASVLSASWTAVTAHVLEGPDAFVDDDGSVHEDAIDAVAAAGWIVGRSPGIFAPNVSVTRAQASSALARMLSSFVELGDFLDPP